MAKYRKKPVVIEAVQFTGKNHEEILIFKKPTSKHDDVPFTISTDYIKIHTLEGIMKAEINDWIIKGVNGEFYPCKPDIFEKTYELVSEEKHEGLY